MKFGEKLMNLRKQNGMSQEELAEKLSVTRQTISKWELDQTTPDMDKLKEIAKIFQVTVDELVNDFTEESTDPIKDNDETNTENKTNYTEKIKGAQSEGDKKIALVIVLIVVGIIIIFGLIPMISVLLLGGKIYKNATKALEDPGNYMNEMLETTSEFYNSIDESGVLNEMIDTNLKIQNKVESKLSSEKTQDQLEEAQQKLEEMQNDPATQQKLQELQDQAQQKLEEMQNDPATQQKLQEMQDQTQQMLQNMKN